jgi:hypothetical protein
MDAMCSSETSVDTEWTTWRYIPDDNIIHDHRSENLKSYIWMRTVSPLYSCAFYDSQNEEPLFT